ncbi:MAG: ATP-binding protein [Clostridium sp.]|nr:ATP-binding protein [Clostridium sp.]
MSLKELVLNFESLSVYRNLLEDKVIKKLHELINFLDGDKLELDGFVRLYNEFFFQLTVSNSTGTFKNYIIEKLIFDENPFSRLAEGVCFEDIDEHLIQAVSKDLDSLYAISCLTSNEIKKLAVDKICSCGMERDVKNKLPDMTRKNRPPVSKNRPPVLLVLEKLPSWEFQKKSNSNRKVFSIQYQRMVEILHSCSRWGDKAKELSEFYYRNGSGMFARYGAFVWESIEGKSCLRGIEVPDPIRLSDFIGYEQERLEVIENTEKFLKGLPANNVLLYGDRGTGKSSTVKAIVNEYREMGLRIIEIPRKHLVDFPAVIRQIKGRKCKFIIFVDDLAFEDSEESYTVLKSILEGGVENRPDNVLIYATSNRRHLIKEKFSDRAGFRSDDPDDEIRAQDTMQEKLSLSERFGITVIFSSPDKKRYLGIVEGLAAQRGINIDRDRLQKEAMKWELMYNGRSARTAKQFVDWLEGNERLRSE